jgi:hypothetical protein
MELGPLEKIIFFHQTPNKTGHEYQLWAQYGRVAKIFQSFLYDYCSAAILQIYFLKLLYSLKFLLMQLLF